ncbi:hypothetical protein HMT_14 [Clostridium phage HM T]|uniref:Uncharacterized protein n=1 Tax=Clostridium saccharoperbutylacetonicum N1-4(HMT) TaxID=931276 RepID=M1MEJ6_9CLOT|nr:hypothetical protein [Clostridium saccharoperbutylacetonicum]AMB17426.1 hypothetical protein HMT_14 [Clostridium phage HM T]AGF54778.1 hypothetical protein Cspa_c10020 [Clostridium saccharoperbutylacetonicum N1-4(HMT)]NRT58701.1 hypothetical protein [Clostridium saccharoperbutylacetonicum]NSB27890.1 hypothetical protein [Clostridium saccharoperbutylacetonicum]NSB41373.1 hypothetical protein [Clostridium saccharoperbutylacetonicum]
MKNIDSSQLETDQDELIQEQLKEVYPIDLTLIYPIGNGFEVIDDTVLDSSNAIKIHVNIDSNKYPKSKVYESIKIACQRFLEYYSYS